MDWVFYICYPIWFKKSKIQVQILIDFGSKINTITLEYVLKLDLKVCLTNVKAQKIDNSTFKTFKIVLTSFQIENMLQSAKFFQETFLLVDLNIKIVLEIPFLTFNNANIKFA